MAALLEPPEGSRASVRLLRVQTAKAVVEKAEGSPGGDGRVQVTGNRPSGFKYQSVARCSD